MKAILRDLYHNRAWKKGHLACFVSQKYYRARNCVHQHTDEDHLRAAAEWLERAQDANTDGGVSGRYHLRRGWTSSYPETTGYIIPTMLTLAGHLDGRFLERANRCKEFLLSVQLDCGGFPGGEIASNATRPSPFNTAQIMHGLIEWYKHSKEDRVLTAAHRAGAWLRSVQESDGSFIRHFYLNARAAYSAHLSCWLAQLGTLTGDNSFLQSAARHLDWVMGHYVPETGWFELSGFDDRQHRNRLAYTHTIAYTLWGTLYTSEILNRRDGIEAVTHAASQLLRRAEILQRLPGELDWKWRSRSAYACLAGNAQMALIWFRLFERTGDARFLNTGLKAIDWVKRTQSMDNSNPGILGGIAGSDPIWGDYIKYAFPNWAAKYFIDALLRKRALLAQPRESLRPTNNGAPHHLPVIETRQSSAPPGFNSRVAILTTSTSSRVTEMMEVWSQWNFRPAVVFIQDLQRATKLARLCEHVAEFGMPGVLAHLAKKIGTAMTRSPSMSQNLRTVREYCRTLGVATVVIGSLKSPESLRRIREQRPDLLVYAGGGILRQPLLSIPRLGTVNAHMGLLPRYRGMNVAEWAMLNGDTVGCSVHLIDRGIDTGDILCVREVSTTELETVASLRESVEHVQTQLLGEVVRYVLLTGELPPRRRQRQDEGRQFFRMHPELLEVVERRLAGNECAKVLKAAMVRAASPARCEERLLWEH